MKQQFVVDALSARDRKDIIKIDLYDRWELNLDKVGGDIEGEIFIKKSVAPPKGSKLRVTIEIMD